MSDDSDPSAEIPLLLQQAASGNREAADRAAELVYTKLRKIAGAVLRRRRPGESLESTQLVNDTLVRLLGNRSIDWQSARQFYAIAARQMRRLRVDYIRARSAKKRAGVKITLDDLNVSGPDAFTVNILATDEILDYFEINHPREVRVFELIAFAGFTYQEASKVLGVAESTIYRDYRFVRNHLEERLRSRGAGEIKGAEAGS